MACAEQSIRHLWPSNQGRDTPIMVTTPFHDLLSGGDPRTLRNVDLVIETVLANPTLVADLVASVQDDDEVVRMRAGDALEKVCRAQPEFVQPHVQTLLGPIAAIDQSSVRWHVAQMLGVLQLEEDERQRALAALRDNLDNSNDWIVLNCTLDTLATLARNDPKLIPELRGYLRRFQTSTHRSVVSQSTRLLKELDAEKAEKTKQADRRKAARNHAR